MELLEVYYTSLGIGGVDAEGLTVTVNQGFVTFFKDTKRQSGYFPFRIFKKTSQTLDLLTFF